MSTRDVTPRAATASASPVVATRTPPAAGRSAVKAADSARADQSHEGRQQDRPAFDFGSVPVLRVPPTDTPSEYHNDATTESRFTRPVAVQSTHPRHVTSLGPLQAKLSVRDDGDANEREADEIAETVMRSPISAPASIAPPRIQRLSVSNAAQSAAPASVEGVLASAGAPLESGVRREMEQRFALDFSHVRIHSGVEAERSARDVQARAYTVGQHIVFNRDQFAPHAHDGRSLLAHELVHVVQQSGGTPAPTGHRSSQPGTLGSGAATSVALQRKPVHTETNDADNATAARNDERVEVTQLKYACVFVGQDLYGIQARRFVKTVMPEHLLIEAASMEEAMLKMQKHSRTALRGGAAARIAQVVLIAHGNATGFVKIPLIKGRKGTTPDEIAQLQDEFKAGAHKQFRETRTDVIALFDESTEVIVRGCRVGRNQETVDALTAFFGGQATVYAAKEYQAFTRRSRSSFDSNPRQAAIKAFDHLAMQGFIPTELVATDDDKVRWVAGHLPDGFVPESFFVDEADVDKVRGAGADDAAIQSLKDYMSAQLIGLEKWGVSTRSAQGDAELDSMSAAEIVALAGEKLAAYKKLEAESPDDWRSIGELAWWVVRCDQAWRRKPEAVEIKPGELDPIGGLYMPGLSYDITLLSMKAAKRPDLKIFRDDAFSSTNLIMPAERPTEEVEDAMFAPPSANGGAHVPPNRVATASGSAPATPTRATPGQSPPAHTAPGASAPSASAPEQAETRLSEDRITPTAPMPEPPVGVDLSTPGGKKAETALVLRGEFKRQFEIKYERQLGYLKVKKASVEFNGKIDFKSDGEKELVIGAFGALATKPGESLSGAGDRLETTLAKRTDKGTGVSGKVTGGLELGGQARTKEGDGGPSTTAGMKRELYLGAQVAWGPIAQELKLVIIGIDETKSGADMFTILGIKWSPIVVQGDFELPVSDGTKVKFAGTVKLTIEAEPDRERIALRLAEAMGRQVAVRAGALAVGGAGAASSVGATEATTVAGGAVVGELIIAGGFVAIGASLVYAYFKSVEEIEDHKELQRGANQGVADFRGGYLAHLGIPSGGSPGGALWKEGQRHAELQLKARIRRAAHFLNEREQKPMFKETDEDLRAAILKGIAQDAESWRSAVDFSYETAVRTMFYKTWLARVSGTMAERNAVYARAISGLSSVELADEPDYSWVNAVGSSGAQGMRRPAHAR
jgi:Domain of unknown function (DUF4157)